MTGCSGPNAAPEAMRNRSEYPICPAAPVMATRMGVLFINLEGEYNFQTRFLASAEQDKLGMQESRKKQFLNSCFPYLFFGRESFCLEFFLFSVKRNRSLKPAETFPQQSQSNV